CAAFYKTQITGDYEYKAEFRIDTRGTVPNAGILFNAQSNTQRNNSYAVRFDGDHVLQWGFFDAGGNFALTDSEALDRTTFLLDQQEFLQLQIFVTSDHYSVRVNGQLVPDAQSVRFTPLGTLSGRQAFPYVGIYSNNTNVLFKAGSATVKVDPKVEATPTPTLSPTPTWTLTPTWTPTNVPTSTPTFTPRPTSTPTWTWTPTFTPFPTSPLPTPTWTPTQVGFGSPIIATPTPDPLDVAAAQLAAQNSTATAIAVQAANSPLATPTWTPTWTPTFTPPPVQLAPASQEMAEAPPVVPPTPVPTQVVAMIVVTEPPPTATATQRPIGDVTPTPRPDSVLLLAKIIDATIAAAGWIWFLGGSLIFFTVAGVLAGLSFRSRERARYDLMDDPAYGAPAPDADDDLARLEADIARSTAAANARQRIRRTGTQAAGSQASGGKTPPDDWPPSLP
ncbi:MAG: DUF1080 domain-containing protein, partial [Caldilineaceae bacterium]|nr:DUF1080 domain-containing protein [Caldilineaceae bacterium]